MPLPAATEKEEEGTSFGRFLYFSFVLFGLAQLIPWNIYIKSIPFFRSKLQDYTHGAEVGSYMSSIYTTFNLATTAILVLLRWDERFMDTCHRVYLGMGGNALLMFMMGVIAAMPISGNSLFGIILAVSACAGVITSALMKGLLEALVRFPILYTPALLAGQAIAGLLISAANAISAAGSQGSTTNSASIITYFAVGGSLLACALSVFAFNFYRSPSFHNRIKTQSQKRTIPFRFIIKVFLNIPFHALGILATLGGTVSLFTAFITAPHSPPLNGRMSYLFTPISFVIYDFGDVIGRWIPVLPLLSLHCRSRIMLSLPYARFLIFSILFILIAPVTVGGKETIPTESVFFSSIDYFYYVICFFFGMSNGYLNTLLLMHTPSASVDQHHITILPLKRSETQDTEEVIQSDESSIKREIAGTLMGLFLIAGLLIGSLSSFLWRSIYSIL